jgi:hypothetical protein
VNCCRRDQEFTVPASWREATWDEKAVASYNPQDRAHHACVQRSNLWVKTTLQEGGMKELLVAAVVPAEVLCPQYSVRRTVSAN